MRDLIWRRLLRYAMERVTEAYDPAFLFFCNEHTFVIAENLRCFVQGLDSSEPLYLGNRFLKKDKKEQVCVMDAARVERRPRLTAFKKITGNRAGYDVTKY